MSMRFPLGYVPDPTDLRDLRVGVSGLAFGASSVPSRYGEMARRYGGRLIVQSAQSCVGFSISEAITARLAVQGVEVGVVPSPRFIWYNSRAQHRAERINTGTYIRSALKQLERLGHCPEDLCESFDGSDQFYATERPSLAAYRAANDRKLKAFQYYRVRPESDYEWKLALSHDDPIVFGMPVTEHYTQLRRHTVYDGDQTPIIGGHAQCALGYDEEGVYGPGTWGHEFGNAGWWKVSWRYLLARANDVWALRMASYYH